MQICTRCYSDAASASEICPRCGGVDLVPQDTPRGAEIVAKRSPVDKDGKPRRRTYWPLVAALMVFAVAIGYGALKHAGYFGSDATRADREKFAAAMTEEMRHGGMRFSVGGPSGRTLEIEWKHCGRPFLREMERKGTLDKYRDLGFNYVSCSGDTVDSIVGKSIPPRVAGCNVEVR